MVIKRWASQPLITYTRYIIYNMSKTVEGITLIHDSWKVLGREMNLVWFLLLIPYLKRYFVNKCCHAWLNTECPGNYHIVSIPIRIHFSFYLIDFLLFLSLSLSLLSSYLIHLNKLVWAEWRVSHSNRSWELLRSWLVSNGERHRQTNTHTKNLLTCLRYEFVVNFSHEWAVHSQE